MAVQLSPAALLASVVSDFVTAWQDPERLFVAEDLAATRQRALRFALTMFALSYGAAAVGVGVIGALVGQLPVFAPVALFLLLSGPLLSTLLLFLESLLVRFLGPQPVEGQRAWDLAIAGVGFAQATLPVLIVPVVGMPIGLLLGARVIVSGLKKLGAVSGERAWLAALVALGLPSLLSLVVRTTAIETYRLPSASMHPTLLAGDVVLATKFDYGLHLPGKSQALRATLPQLGELVVFSRSDDEPAQLVKRVVGLPGDRIELRERVLWRNGSPVESLGEGGPCEYLDIDQKQPLPGTLHKCLARAETLGGKRYAVVWDQEPLGSTTPQSFTVLPDSVFVVGDNRDNSHDSRHFGAVPMSRVTGRVRRVLWSFAPTGVFRRERTLLALP